MGILYPVGTRSTWMALLDCNNSSQTELAKVFPRDWNKLMTEGSHTLTSKVRDLTCNETKWFSMINLKASSQKRKCQLKPEYLNQTRLLILHQRRFCPKITSMQENMISQGKTIFTHPIKSTYIYPVQMFIVFTRDAYLLQCIWSRWPYGMR